MRRVVCTAAALLMVTVSGCGISSLAKRGIEEVKGASGDLVVIEQLDAATLAGASDILAGRIDNDAGPECPADFLVAFQRALQEELDDVKQELAVGTGSPLRVDGRVLYFRPRGIEKLLGSTSLILARVEVSQSGSNRRAGRANVLASTEALRSESGELAEAMAEEVAGWIEKRGRRDE